MNILKSKSVWVLTTVVLALGYMASCTKNDQYIGPKAKVSATTLISKKVATAPTMDGVVDASWDAAAKIEVTPQVPDAGNGMFTGYIGETYPTTLRSMYDDQYIYFLAEWNDASKSEGVATWYYKPGVAYPATGWAQESSSGKTFDANGTVTRDCNSEDKFAMLWNIDNSTSKFTAQTCYSSCHIFTPYMDYSKTPAVIKSNAGSGNHYTNGANEKIDMWWCHMNKDLVYQQMDDNYQDWAGGPGVTNLTGGSGNGRHVDGISVASTSTTWPNGPVYGVSPAQGSTTNRQALKLNDTGATVNVPMWIIPNATNYYYIKTSDTLPGGAARKITNVSLTGVLTYAGGTIDPASSAVDYAQTPGLKGNGAKCFPSYIVAPLIGERADISCVGAYTGSAWKLEFKRKLKTGDILKQDIDFSSLQDQPFGIAVWNNSNYQHGIKPNLLLHFEK